MLASDPTKEIEKHEFGFILSLTKSLNDMEMSCQQYILKQQTIKRHSDFGCVTLLKVNVQ
jgi:hypothetical protein